MDIELYLWDFKFVIFLLYFFKRNLLFINVEEMEICIICKDCFIIILGYILILIFVLLLFIKYVIVIDF